MIEGRDQDQNYIGEGTYRIDPKTILEAIKVGEPKIFTLKTETTEDEVKAGSSYQWSQTDFIEVSTAFQKEILSKTAADQKIDRMLFGLDDCKDVNLGAQRAYIFTYMLESGYFVWPPFNVASYSYSIDLPSNELRWSAKSYDKYVGEEIHSVLDFAQIKISAEEALRIAELNGGKDARLSVENQCSINLEIDANSNNGNWVVNYGSLFRIEIDKANGSYIIRARGERGTFGFDSESILDSLKAGNKNVFTKLSASSSDNTIVRPVQWTQDDYFRVADAFMQVVWNERLNEWNLDGLYFETSCDDASLGPQLMKIIIFRESIPDHYYFDGQIDIKAGQNILTWTRRENYIAPDSLLTEKDRTKLSWTQIKIPANQALQIVEDQGGKNMRLEFKQNSPGENCKINGWLNRWATTRVNTEWDINYFISNTKTLISASVDMETGIFDINNYYKSIP